MFYAKQLELSFSWKFTAIVIFVLLSLSGGAQELAKRLILKDGSYQLVTEYEVKGDRVSYFSAERNDWEELPKDLVDWPATEKFEKERATPAIPEAAAIDKESDAPLLPTVAPGLRLPEESGVFLLDNYQGQPQLIELEPLEGDVGQRAKAGIFRGPFAPMTGKQSIELEGEHAIVKAHVGVPSIYINVEDDPNQPPPGQTASAQPSQPSLDAPRAQPQQAEGPIVPSDRFRLVRAKVKTSRRIISDLKRDSTGKNNQNPDFIKTTIDQIGHGWVKLTPAEELAPGEYALIEMKGNEGMDLYVWDFGINPNAPANANPWKAEEKQ